MSFEIALYSLIGISGGILAYQDFKSQNVSALPLLLFLASCTGLGFATKNFCCFPLLIFFGISLGFYLLKKKQAFGIADYVVVLAVSFLISNDSWPFFLILSGAFGVVLSVFFKSPKFPFIPGILMATLFVKFLEKV